MRYDPFTPAAPTTATPQASPPQAQPTPPAKTTGLKKLNFGAATVKKAETKTAYPVFQDPNGQAALIAARIKTRQEELDALEGAIQTDKAELRLMVSPFYFTVNHGRHEVPSSISVPSASGEVLVTFQNRYAKLEDDRVLSILLGDRLEQCFRQAFDFKISGDKLPGAEAQVIFDEIQQVLARHNATEALEVNQSIKPVKEFHAARHLNLSVEENLAIEEVCPIITMIKTKGREK